MRPRLLCPELVPVGPGVVAVLNNTTDKVHFSDKVVHASLHWPVFCEQCCGVSVEDSHCTNLGATGKHLLAGVAAHTAGPLSGRTKVKKLRKWNRYNYSLLRSHQEYWLLHASQHKGRWGMRVAKILSQIVNSNLLRFTETKTPRIQRYPKFYYWYMI